MSRGFQGQAIFNDDKDRRHFLELLAKMVERYNVLLHAYVLMANHYHLLLETTLLARTGSGQPCRAYRNFEKERLGVSDESPDATFSSALVRYGQGTNSTPHITETFSYDRNGAMTQWVSGTNVLSLTYDELGRFANDATAYDALGNRIRTADGKYWVPNHADPLKRPLIECAADGSVLRHFIWADDRLLGFIDASGLLTVAHCDEQGSVMALTDANGNILHTAFYGPYGEDWGSTGTNPTPFTWLGGHGVQTIDSDTPLRLYLTRHRVYSATLNRFLSADPISLEGGLNLYAYGEGNPMAYIDPLGLLSWRQVGYFAAGVVVGAVVTAAVIAAAPVVVTGLGVSLMAAGLTASTAATVASATVTTGIVVAGGLGIATTGLTTIKAVQEKNWDTVAFNFGSVVGGFAAGGFLGRTMVNGMQGYPSRAPKFIFRQPIVSMKKIATYENAMRYDPNYPKGSILKWVGSAPTPAAGLLMGFPGAGGASGLNAFYWGTSNQNAYSRDAAGLNVYLDAMRGNYFYK